MSRRRSEPEGVEVKSWRGTERRWPVGPVSCGECATVHESRSCPTCGEAPDGLMVGVLRTEVVTQAGARWVVTAERDADSGGWAPVRREAMPWTRTGEEAR
jgi:hypothetical protein